MKLSLLLLLSALGVVLLAPAFAQQNYAPPVDTTVISQNNCYNSGAAMLLHWRAAVARVRAGAGNARVLFIGDSTTAGVNSTPAATWPNDSRHFANLLKAQGITATESGWMGLDAALRLTTDPRISAGSWSQFGGTPTLGGQLLQSNGAGAVFSYTPVDQVDTFKVWYDDYSASATFSGQINSGSTTNVVSTGSNSVKTTTFTGTLGANTLKLNYVSGASTQYILGVEAYNSSVSSVQVTNAGWWGSKSSDWIGNAIFWAYLPTLTSYAADLVVIKPGINDAGNSVPTATFIANIQTIITTAQTAGSDVLLVSSHPNSNPFQAQYVPALKALALQNNIPFVDVYNRWGSWASANALGFESDSVHPNAVGFGDSASAEFQCVMR